MSDTFLSRVNMSGTRAVSFLGASLAGVTSRHRKSDPKGAVREFIRVTGADGTLVGELPRYTKHVNPATGVVKMVETPLGAGVKLLRQKIIGR